MSKDKKKKIVAVYIGGLGKRDTITGIPARDLTEDDIEKIEGGLDFVLSVPKHSDYKLYEKPSKSSKSDKPKIIDPEDQEVDNG